MTVARRLGEIFKPDDVVDEPRPTTSDEPVGPYPAPTPILAPDLPVEAGDRIRAALRVGAYKVAAELAAIALGDLEMDVAEGARASPVGLEPPD